MGCVADGASLLIKGAVLYAGSLQKFFGIRMTIQTERFSVGLEKVGKIRSMSIVTVAAAFCGRFVFIFQFELTPPVQMAKETHIRPFEFHQPFIGS
jgi:hypothetical protein